MKKLLAVLMVFTISLGLFACSNQESVDDKKSEATDTSWSQIAEKGKIVVGNCPEYPPFSFRNSNDEIEGFDSDYARALGEEMGVEVEIRDTAWEGLVAGLQKGDHDIIISCMSPEEATAASENVNMSNAYYNLSEVIVTRSEDESIKSKEDLKGKVVGAQASSTSEVAVDSLKDMGIETKEIKKYNRNSEALADLKNGRVDAVVVGIAYAATQAKENPEIKVVNDPIRSVEIVVVMNKGAEELNEKVNQAIEAVKESGKYDEINKKWLDI